MKDINIEQMSEHPIRKYEKEGVHRHPCEVRVIIRLVFGKLSRRGGIFSSGKPPLKWVMAKG